MEIIELHASFKVTYRADGRMRLPHRMTCGGIRRTARGGLVEFTWRPPSWIKHPDDAIKWALDHYGLE